MNEIDIRLLETVTRCHSDEIEYIEDESYPQGRNNCCYFHVYKIFDSRYSVECRCGCATQLHPDGSLVTFQIERYNN